MRASPCFDASAGISLARFLSTKRQKPPKKGHLHVSSHAKGFSWAASLVSAAILKVNLLRTGSRRKPKAVFAHHASTGAVHIG